MQIFPTLSYRSQDASIFPTLRLLVRASRATLGAPAYRHVEAELAVRNKPLIAIVDDDEGVREATKGLMRSMGLTAEAFSSGEDFLRSPHLARAACLVADINMPGMSGLELYRHVAALPKSIPTILITAYPNESVRARALSAGVVGYLAKPFTEDDLLHCIRSALNEDEREEEAC